MEQRNSNIFYARNITEFFQQISNITGLQIIGGCTALEHMPEKTISTTLTKDFKQIHKHERFIEFGPGTCLSDILDLGERNLPQILLESIQTVANSFVRNIATIGGNIMNTAFKGTLFAPLLALDASLEFKSSSDTQYVNLLNFTEIPKGHILTNIRIPMNDWDVTVYRRLGPAGKITDDSASFAFLADSEKSAITNLRIAFSGKITFRCQELENKMLGTRLPLQVGDIAAFVEESAAAFDRAAEGIEYNPVLRQQFLNLTRYSFEQLT